MHWDMLLQDLRYAARSLQRSRGFALTTVLITALGVGANTATFSVADFVLVRPLPFARPQELVRLCEGPRGGGGWGCMNQMAPANYRDVVERGSSFKSWGAFSRTEVNVLGAGDPVRVPAARLTPEVFPLLGVSPRLGRAFEGTNTLDDEAVVVLGYGLWQGMFGGDANVIGKVLRVDGASLSVIGVMPASFRFPDEAAQLWLPLVLRPEDYADRGNNFLEGIGRLKDGVSFEQARSDLFAIADRLARAHPETNAERGFSFFRLRDEMSPRFRLVLLALCGASLCMLLLACANLANLLLVRAAGRKRELAVRIALGAGRERLVRQLLTESVMLALIGGAVGALAAAGVVPVLARLVPSTLPLASQPALDLRAFALAVVFSALTGLGFGLAPALRAGGTQGFLALREGDRGGARRQRLRTVLVAVQVAVSLVLLISSGLLIRAMSRVRGVATGFEAERALTLRTALPSPKYDEPARRVDFYRRVLSEVRALPGVEAAGYTNGLPMVLTGGISRVSVPGDEPRSSANRSVSRRWVTPQFFAALRIPLLRGRDFEDADGAAATAVAVVSESFVRRHWPTQDPLGRTFEVLGRSRSVVGVVGDVKVRGLERTSEPQVYLPAAQSADTNVIFAPRDLVVRLSRPGSPPLAAIREIVKRVDSEQPVSNLRPMSEVVDGETATRRAQVRVLGALASLALLLAAVGIHGLLAFSVAQRSREIGVRLALGAQPASVAGMIVSEAARMAIVGVVPGLLAGYAAARAMSSLLFGIPAADRVTFAAAASLCFAAAVLGCLPAGVRAARTDPISALRAD